MKNTTGFYDFIQAVIEEEKPAKVAMTESERLIESMRLALEETTPEQPGAPWNHKKHRTHQPPDTDEWI